MSDGNSKIYIVRIINKDSDPMVGYVNPTGKVGTMCWDNLYERRNFRPHDRVLVNKNTFELIENQSED